MADQLVDMQSIESFGTLRVVGADVELAGAGRVEAWRPGILLQPCQGVEGAAYVAGSVVGQSRQACARRQLGCKQGSFFKDHGPLTGSHPLEAKPFYIGFAAKFPPVRLRSVAVPQMASTPSPGHPRHSAARAPPVAWPSAYTGQMQAGETMGPNRRSICSACRTPGGDGGIACHPQHKHKITGRTQVARASKNREGPQECARVRMGDGHQWPHKAPWPDQSSVLAQSGTWDAQHSNQCAVFWDHGTRERCDDRHVPKNGWYSLASQVDPIASTHLGLAGAGIDDNKSQPMVLQGCSGFWVPHCPARTPGTKERGYRAPATCNSFSHAYALQI